MPLLFNPVRFSAAVCNISIEDKANYLQLTFFWEKMIRSKRPSFAILSLFSCFKFWSWGSPNKLYSTWEEWLHLVSQGDEGNKSRALARPVEERHTLQSTGWKGGVQKGWQSREGQEDALRPDRCDAQSRDLCRVQLPLRSAWGFVQERWGKKWMGGLTLNHLLCATQSLITVFYSHISLLQRLYF